MPWQPIEVSSKILGHISTGVYRSAGGAIKELISNAFDADSTKVVLTTNWPSFDIITCRDNGIGMTAIQFEQMMTGGIGDSTKRVSIEVNLKYKRPIIGRLGIGMLGIAQLCHEFKVISHHRKSGTAFEATIKLIDFLREKIDDLAPEHVGDAKLDVGQFDIRDIPYDESQAGTYVVASDMRSAFIRKFRENPGPPLPSKFTRFLDIVRDSRSVKELGDYWQMVWEVSVACPIQYMPDGLFQWERIEIAHDENVFRNKIDLLTNALKDYAFEVILDGLPLRKPNAYPFPSDCTGILFPVDKNLEVYSRPLRILGYIYLQDGRAIEPMDLRGLLIRIRNVAIGSYDQSFLKYPKAEGPRFYWLSSELYVQEGLENALNIDRDSFNELHPHYVKLQQIVHQTLDDVFSTASKRAAKRSKVKITKEREDKQVTLTNLILQELGDDYVLKENEDRGLPTVIDQEQKAVTFNTRSPLWPRTINDRAIMRMVSVAYELSLLEDPSQQRQSFYALLCKLLNS